MEKSKDILLLALNIYSIKGGIETGNKILSKALNDIAAEGSMKFMAMSLHDNLSEAPANYQCFNGNKWNFIKATLKFCKGSSIVIITHLHLQPVGQILQLSFPTIKIFTFLHGIEAWEKLSFIKQKIFRASTKLIAVSNFTKDEFSRRNNFNKEKIAVLHHCISPYLPQKVERDNRLRKKFNFPESSIVLMSLGRISEKDRSKGYFTVLQTLRNLDKSYKYLLCGKISPSEKTFFETFIKENGLADNVVITGEIDEQNIASYFSIADIYIMPSTKEGFGISFIEAMHYGLPVIGGAKDGTVDALQSGKFGLTVKNPTEEEELKEAIETVAANIELYKQKAVEGASFFSYTVYKKKLFNLLNG